MIRLERRSKGIVWVWFARPQARNALTFAMWDALAHHAAELDRDPTVRAIVFCGDGGEAFVSGTEIGEFRGFSADDGVAYEARVERALTALEAIRVPTLAAIRGACTGGGVAIAATCDLRIGAPGARIGIPIARTLGNAIALKNCARLARLIGLDTVKRLILTAALLDADAALRCGFLCEITASDTVLEAHVQATAEGLIALAPLTLRSTKEMVRRLAALETLPSDEDLLRLCYGSADFARGVAAFLEKQPAEWTGS